jgi:hypothetical protein
LIALPDDFIDIDMARLCEMEETNDIDDDDDKEEEKEFKDDIDD